MGKINYNELMKNLDNCLGLEKSATESIQKPAVQPNSSAFEGYDDIERELALEMGLRSSNEEKDDDLIFEEESEGGEVETTEVEEPKVEEVVDHKEVFKSSAKEFFTELCQEVGEEEAKVTLGNLINEVIGSSSGEETVEEPAEECGVEPATEGSLTDKLIALGKTGAVEGEAVEGEPAVEEVKEEPAEEGQESLGDSDDKNDADAAFEAMSAKMLSRYSSLAKPSKKVNSATEGQSSQEVAIDDEALRRVSCEFGYSGQHLRKMVTEAINKGVI